MGDSKYKETDKFEENISPASTFDGNQRVEITNTETGESHTGRGSTYEQARDDAITRHIESDKK